MRPRPSNRWALVVSLSILGMFLSRPFHKLMAMSWIALALLGVVFAAGFPLYVLG